MSQINVNTIRNRTGGPPNLDKGAVVTGILTCTGNVSVGGTLTYEDVTNIDSTGIVTAKSGIKVGNAVSPGIGATIDPNGNAVFAGIVTASSFSGIESDKIFEGNTEVEVIDTGSDGHVKMTTEGGERVRVGPAGQIGLGGANYGTSGQVLTSGGSGGTVAWSTVDAAPSLKLNASGTIAAGKPTVVNADGTVSEVKNTVSGITDITYTGQLTYFSASNYPTSLNVPGTNQVLIAERDGTTGNAGQVVCYTITNNLLTNQNQTFFEGTAASNITISWDSGQDRFCIFYCDEHSNQDLFKCRPGKLVGNTITLSGDVCLFPSSQVIARGVRTHGSVYDPDSGKIVVAFADGSGNAYAYVCTIDGAFSTLTPVSFGARTTITTGDVQAVDCTYDTVNNKVLVQVRKGSSGDVYMTSYVGTVSGTSISFGSADTIVSTQTTGAMGIVYMTEQQKAFCIYNDSANDGGRLYSKIGTVSGDSITWGTGVKCGTNNNTLVIANAYASLTYDTYSKLPAMTWRATSSGDSIAVVSVKSISGTTPTFSNIVEVSGGGGCQRPFIDNLDSDAGVLNIFMNSSGNGKYVVVKTSSTTTNVTGENFLGLSAASYTNGQEATIQISGNSNSNQVGLTTGQNYFVQNNGTLGLTAASPKVYAGTAVSQTKLVVGKESIADSAMEIIARWDFGANYGQNYFNHSGLDNTTYIKYRLEIAQMQFVGNGAKKVGLRIYDKDGALKTDSNYKYNTQKKSFTTNTQQNESNSGNDKWLWVGTANNDRNYYDASITWHNRPNPASALAYPIMRADIYQNAWYSWSEAMQYGGGGLTNWFSGFYIYNYTDTTNLCYGKATLYGYKY